MKVMLNIILIVSLNVAILIMVSYLWSLNESFNCPKNGMIKCDRIHNKKMRENVCELLNIMHNLPVFFFETNQIKKTCTNCLLAACLCFFLFSKANQKNHARIVCSQRASTFFFLSGKSK